MSNIFRKQGINTGSGGGGSIDTSSLANKTDLTAIILTGTTNTSGNVISAGTWFYLNGKPCIAKVDIASGATFTEGTNYEEKTIGSALSELNSKITYNSVSRNEKVTVNSSLIIKNGSIIQISVNFTTSESLPAWSDLVSLPFNTFNFSCFILDYSTGYFAKDANTNDLIILQNTNNPSITLNARPLYAGTFDIRCLAMVN